MSAGTLAGRLAAGLVAAALLACQPQAAADARIGQSIAGLEQQLVTIESTRPSGGGAARRYRFLVEVARTPEQKQYGLMNRRSLGPDRGMIFPFPELRPVSFWMKDTLIPLDLLFVRPDGRIARIAERAEPRSLAPISSGEPVAAVLEIAGGRSAELGIAPGDRLVWRR